MIFKFVKKWDLTNTGHISVGNVICMVLICYLSSEAILMIWDVSHCDNWMWFWTCEQKHEWISLIWKKAVINCTISGFPQWLGIFWPFVFLLQSIARPLLSFGRGQGRRAASRIQAGSSPSGSPPTYLPKWGWQIQLCGLFISTRAHVMQRALYAAETRNGVTTPLPDRSWNLKVSNRYLVQINLTVR